jgi:hypothetical protein
MLPFIQSIQYRQSFGGFNPLVEQNVKSGLWRPFHLDPFEEGRPEEDDNELSDLEEERSEGEEKAKKYGSLVGTLAKRFMRKRDRGGKSTKVKKEEKEVVIVGIEMSSTKGKRTKSKDSSTRSKKRKAEEEDDEGKGGKEKRKFMKPNDE